uniref:Wntless-like transmembrane domain-containing protein n=1 Tax=Coccolithus braarudii TaxID=221442 RepID=A0A7S0LA54_9EUKA|mmetsp:Transcript_29042/g.62472  ORF Transcript_29042/g.62472 Transcript_29042/m.62472 type:complete len:447 (+) Transcript_29042:181-1521(+)
MCSCNYTYVGPALLVLPLFFISLINLFVAGPPLKTIVLDSSGPSYSATLPYLSLHVEGSSAKFHLKPKDEMTHFFVVTCYTPAKEPPLYLDAQVVGKKMPRAASTALVSTSTRPDSEHVSSVQDTHALQMLQPLLGYSEYQVNLKAYSSASGANMKEAQLPSMEFRVTYVPTRFTYTQICVRAFFTCTSICLLIAYAVAMCRTNTLLEHGQLWMTALLVLLLALNDPLYIARVYLGGDQLMYTASVLGQILFSGGLFLFWLVYADGMNSTELTRPFCSFYVPKIALVLMYVAVSAAMFILHGRVPDRIDVGDSGLDSSSAQLELVVALSASLIGVGVWLSCLVGQAIYRLGWKKVEYIYTEREKSFVGITMVFVILWLCGHLYRAVHGRRGSWMQLQLPFLTLTNSYLALLTHAFWPNEGRGQPHASDPEGGRADAKEQGLLDDED